MASLVLLIAGAGCRTEEPEGSMGVRRISDYAGLLSARQVWSLAEFLDFVAEDRGVDYRVVIRDDPEIDLALEAVSEYQRQGIGASTDGQGLLLLIDVGAGAARVEVGYELEHRVRDAEASSMITEFLAPYFASGRAGVGIEASVERLVEVLEPTRDEFRRDDPLLASGGAGANAALFEGIDELTPETKARLQKIMVPQNRPEESVRLEVELMLRGIYFQDVPLYDKAWRRMERPQRPPRRMMAWARQLDAPFEVARSGEFAIAYFTGENRQRNGPWFLRQTSAGWVLETSVVFEKIVYDYSNLWYALDGDYPYLELIKSVYPMRPMISGRFGASWGIDPEVPQNRRRGAPHVKGAVD